MGAFLPITIFENDNYHQFCDALLKAIAHARTLGYAEPTSFSINMHPRIMMHLQHLIPSGGYVYFGAGMDGASEYMWGYPLHIDPHMEDDVILLEDAVTGYTERIAFKRPLWDLL